MCPDKQRIKCTVAYDGAHYSGWQVQPGKNTVQLHLETAFQTVFQQALRIQGSGRTDTGVHARGQVFHCDIPPGRKLDRLNYSLNALLPDDIRVTSVQAENPDFHARYDAVKKEYRYFIYNHAILLPTVRHYRWHVRYPLDVEAMRCAAEALIGEHDFSSFAANPNRTLDSTVRTLHRLSIRQQGPEIMIRAAGNGFLYKMVRSLTGFLVDVGRGRLEPRDAARLLKEGRRTREVKTAPPQGLFLWQVWY